LRYLLSAVPLFFDWDKNRICFDENIKENFEEFETIDHLKQMMSIEKVKNACKLNEIDKKTGLQNANKDLKSWEFYVQKDNMITWRKEKEKDSGQYIYKGVCCCCLKHKSSDIMIKDVLYF
jgi:hypothetical protein